MQLQFWAATDVGLTRDHNEDNYLVDRKINLFVVADGMGGHAAGEIASSVAVHEVRKILTERRDVIDRYERSGSVLLRQTVLALLDEAIREACALVYKLAQEDSERHGMGTTLSLLLLIRNRAFVGHVGDSRIYRTRQGAVTMVTEDHSVINELIKSGRLKPEEAFNSPYKNAVTRAVGVHPTVEVDTFDFGIEPNDNYLLCSDGLSCYLEDPLTLEVMTLEKIKEIPQRFIDHANQSGGKDNITAVIVRVIEVDHPSTTTSMGLHIPPLSSPKTGVLGTYSSEESSDEIPELSSSELSPESTPPPLPSQDFSRGDLTPASHKIDQLPLNLLKVSPLFGLLGDSALETFVRYAHVIELDAEAALHFQGDQDPTLYALLDGEMRAERDDVATSVLNSGALVGENQLLMTEPVAVTLIANRRALLLAWSISALRDVMIHQPEISARMMWGLALLNHRRVHALQGSLDSMFELLEVHTAGTAQSAEALRQAAPFTQSFATLLNQHAPLQALPSFVSKLPPVQPPTFAISPEDAEAQVAQELSVLKSSSTSS